jgi:hypothetical protein
MSSPDNGCDIYLILNMDNGGGKFLGLIAKSPSVAVRRESNN